MEKADRYVCIGIEEDQKWVQVTAFIKAWINRLDKLAEQHPNMVKHVRDHIFEDNNVAEGKEYLVDKKLITPTSIKMPKKKLTDEEKQAVVNRLQKTRKPREKKSKITN